PEPTTRRFEHIYFRIIVVHLAVIDGNAPLEFSLEVPGKARDPGAIAPQLWPCLFAVDIIGVAARMGHEDDRGAWVLILLVVSEERPKVVKDRADFVVGRPHYAHDEVDLWTVGGLDEDIPTLTQRRRVEPQFLA